MAFRGIALAFGSENSHDGLGAQALRLMGTFGAAQSLGISYVHQPITFIEPNPGDPLRNQYQQSEFLFSINRTFELPGVEGEMFDNIRSLESLTRNEVIRIKSLKLASVFGRKTILIKVDRPFPFVDNSEGMYSQAAQILAERFQGEIASEFRVDVHIRRALVSPKDSEGNSYIRFVHISWYKEVIKVIIKTLDSLNIPFSIRLHTDIPTQPWRVPQEISKASFDLISSLNLIDERGWLKETTNELKELLDLAPIEVVQEWDQLKSLNSMINSGLLVGYASAFSFVAGLLRGSRPTIQPMFVHRPSSKTLVLPLDNKSFETSSIESYLLNNLV